jgi:predicted ester cyclase
MTHSDPWTGSFVAGPQQPEGEMTRDEIEALFARRQDAWDRLDAAGVVADYSDDCVVDSPYAGTLIGRVANEQMLRSLFAAFPDVKQHTEELLIDGNQVAQLVSSTGTDIGGFMDLEPTGKAFRVPCVFLYTLKDRQIVRERRIYDFTGLLVQVGILKVKPT